MREIKFRAWNFVTNTMFSAEEMTTDQMALLPDGHFANIHSDSTEKSIIYPHDKMMPMQFTGLLDKNGVEIYEGDYVVTSGRPKDRGVVEYSHTGAWVLARGSSKVLLHELVYHNWALQVIGNIYENPELVE